MERRTLGFASVFALAVCTIVTGSARTQDEPRDAATEAALEEARSLAADLSGTLRSLLVAELQRGGYEGALRACSETAPRMTREWRQRTGQEARRVSLKNRNPENAPDAYERGVLEEMDRRKSEGKEASEHVAVVLEDGRRVLRYLQPLVTAPVCLNCHGTADDLSPRVRALLAERYPGDRATGYATGDIRGAVTVKVALPDPSGTP